MAENRADPGDVRAQSPSKISFSETAREASPTDEEGPKTTRRAVASRRIPKKKEPELDPEQAALYAKQQQAALAAAQLGSKKGATGSSRVLLALIAGLALGAGGVGAYYRHVTTEGAAPSPQPSTSASLPERPASAAPDRSAAPPQPALPPLPTWLGAELSFEPADADISVDGQPVGASGTLNLRGEEGHSFAIELSAKGKRKTFNVMLTDTGADPDSISLDEPVTAPPTFVRPPPGLRPPPLPRPPPTAAPPLPPPDDDIYE